MSCQKTQEIDISLRHAVFVYGTLKRGFTNYVRYLGLAEASGKAAFGGAATTAEPLQMVVRPPEPPRSSGAPQLMDSAGAGHRVLGEVFFVDDDALEALDLLEGVQTGRYYRRKIEVCLADSSDEALCMAYFAKATEELLSLPPWPAFTVEHDAAYQPKPLREDILALCTVTPPSASSRVSDSGESLHTQQIVVC